MATKIKSLLDEVHRGFGIKSRLAAMTVGRYLRYTLAREFRRIRHGWTYGVEIHANALQNLLDFQYIRPAGNAIVWTMLLVLAVLTAGIVFWRGAVWGAGAAVAGALGSSALAFQQFGSSFLWLPIVAPMVAIVAAYLGSTAYVSIVEGRDKRFIKSAFGKFVSPSVVDEIAADPAKLKLGADGAIKQDNFAL